MPQSLLGGWCISVSVHTYTHQGTFYILPFWLPDLAITAVEVAQSTSPRGFGTEVPKAYITAYDNETSLSLSLSLSCLWPAVRGQWQTTVPFQRSKQRDEEGLQSQSVTVVHPLILSLSPTVSILIILNHAASRAPLCSLLFSSSYSFSSPAPASRSVPPSSRILFPFCLYIYPVPVGAATSFESAGLWLPREEYISLFFAWVKDRTTAVVTKAPPPLKKKKNTHRRHAAAEVPCCTHDIEQTDKTHTHTRQTAYIDTIRPSSRPLFDVSKPCGIGTAVLYRPRLPSGALSSCLESPVPDSTELAAASKSHHPVSSLPVARYIRGRAVHCRRTFVRVPVCLSAVRTIHTRPRRANQTKPNQTRPNQRHRFPFRRSICRHYHAAACLAAWLPACDWKTISKNKKEKRGRAYLSSREEGLSRLEKRAYGYRDKIWSAP
ncbi:hypothetical protein LY76DRAFT_58605 [Colletotrichum caudatum]|nr:hypothetical protein LY76DRAFT_58605 [Colletotrichum caudatum]